ncbi:metalloendopeptidase OMA1, mitochondrial isoform X2 [Monomorium pharaonis]|uniref:metalloendopeptidase OMA1, mitochondrial isoform X2 n=1 Tax=Monomorium pharaonis TaxID=307658 RepID=UPI00063FBFCE|nr:metalloendopeptidase OMA1, mitochondrial isoform X2 [Monomorium pharaonis]
MLTISRSLCQKNLQQATTGHFVICFMRSCHRAWPYKRFLIQDKVDCGAPRYLKLQKCDFRTTQNLFVPPLLALILRPVLRISSLLMGRSMKRWWTRKSEQEKEEYKQWFRGKSNVFLSCFGVYVLILATYYITHLETNPLTKRTRFIIFNQEQEKKLGKMVLEAGGNIFVSLDILKITENDDQLGIVLAHEMAHSLLLHSLEVLSDQLLWDFLIAIPILLIWALFPDFSAAIIHFIGERIVNVMYNLPLSRILENEADEVGLKLAAKACIDIREAVVFWATMRTLTEMHTLPPELPWISTHPAHGDREKRLNEIMAKTLELRKESGCPVLPRVDPRDEFYKRSIKEKEFYFKQRGII